jgi:Ca2+-binding RTX toxin-like protein
VQMLGSGFWNDLPAGSTVSQADGSNRASVIEFNLGAAGVVAPGVITRQVRSTVALNNTQAMANALLAGANRLDERTRIYPVINLAGNGDGLIPGGLPMPFPGDIEHYATETTGSVFIPSAGDWTFAVTSDDGFELTFPGANATLHTITNGQGTTTGLNGALRFEGGRGASAATLGVFTFPAAGFYNLRLVHYEATGGDSVEMSAAAGSFTATNAGFQVVGATASGGLAVYTGLPTAGSSATVTITLVGENDAPVAGTVAAQAINEGQSVTFTMVGAFDVDAGAVLTYDWDINGDGSFDFSTAANTLTLTEAQLNAFGIDGPYSGDVNVRVRDEFNAVSATVATNLTVASLAPSLSFSGPENAGPGMPLDFVFSATDPSTPDTAAGFTFQIQWGDSQVSNFNNVTGGATTHTYAQPGNYTITVRVTDKDGAFEEITHPVSISQMFIDDETGDLVIVGGPGPNRIVVNQVGGGIQVRMNNRLMPNMAPISDTIRIYGGPSNDRITVANNVGYRIFADGGGGNDYIAGGPMDDILYGGDGNDRLLGGRGNDLLVGGNGNDTISGGVGDDIIYGNGEVDEFGEAWDDDSYVGNNTLLGDGGNDIIYGGAQRDRINGGAGNDILFGGDGPDLIRGGAGHDLLFGGGGSDALYGDAGNDVLIAGDSGNTLYGGAGNDVLIGGNLDEEIAYDLFEDWLNIGVFDIDYLRGIYSSAVENNGTPDNLFGQGGSDWFLGFLPGDRARDGRSGDIIDIF